MSFTGLLIESPADIAARMSKQIAMPVCAPTVMVAEKLWSDPPPFVRIENQQQTNMCAAHAGTSCIEVDWYQATGEMVQRSRNWLYAYAQQKCHLFGDQGVTLGSIIATLQQDGCPPEDLYPFKGYFSDQIPAGIRAEAEKCKVLQTIDVRSGGYNSVRTVIGQNLGAVLIATYWPIQYSQGYVVERYVPLDRFGHARAWLALSSRLDGQGRPYVWCANSHSTAAQFHGWELWSPQAIDEQLSRDTWGTTGITSMTTPAPREVDWTGADNPFRR